MWYWYIWHYIYPTIPQEVVPYVAFTIYTDTYGNTVQEGLHLVCTYGIIVQEGVPYYVASTTYTDTYGNTVQEVVPYSMAPAEIVQIQ